MDAPAPRKTKRKSATEGSQDPTTERLDGKRKTSSQTAKTKPSGRQSTKGVNEGLIKRLADAITSETSLARDAAGRLYCFSGGAYRLGGQLHVQQRVKQLLEDWELSAMWRSKVSKEVAEYIRLDAPLLWEAPLQDVLNVRNGLLDLPSGELRPHDATHLSPVQLPVLYDAEADCPAWESFVADVFPQDAIGLAWELVAWLMTVTMSLHKAALLLGEGANGKSIFLSALSAFLGRENVSNLALQKLEADRFAMARLLGKLANICSDIPNTRLVGTSSFKAITGGDRVTAEFKYRDSFEFTPFARLIFSANEPPLSPDASAGFYRRWLVIPFTRTFAEGDPKRRNPEELLAELTAPGELSGLLNRALAVRPRLRQRGFTESESTQLALRGFRGATDPVAVWLDTHTVDEPRALVPKQALFAAYREECLRNNRAPATENAFGRALRQHRPHLREAQRPVRGKRQWVWLGIGLGAGRSGASGAAA
jgi:P4 family phage/plasmid primase-like protien